MSTLAEIEAAAAKLPSEEKQELLLFLAVRLRGERGAMPEPRKFTKDEMEAWIAEDEAEYVSIVCTLARDVESRKIQRKSQRSRMLLSPLCDAKATARSMEKALEGMYDQWMAGRQNKAVPAVDMAQIASSALFVHQEIGNEPSG